LTSDIGWGGNIRKKTICLPIPGIGIASNKSLSRSETKEKGPAKEKEGKGKRIALIRRVPSEGGKKVVLKLDETRATYTPDETGLTTRGFPGCLSEEDKSCRRS